MSQDEDPGKKSSLEKEHYTLLLDVSEALVSSLDMKKTFNIILDKVIDALRAERAFVMMRYESSDDWICQAARNVEQQDIDKWEFNVSRSVINKVREEGISICTHNALEDLRFKDLTSVRIRNLRSILCVPLIIKEKILGVIYADNSLKSGVFGRKETELLEGIARQAANSIENAMLYGELEEKSRCLQYILEKASLLHRFQNIDTLLKSIMTVLVGLLKITDGFIALKPELFALPEEKSQRALDSAEYENLSIVYGVGRFEDNPRDRSKRNALQFLDDHDTQHIVISDKVVSIPLKTGDKTIGVIFLERSVEQKIDMSLLEIFAIQASLAIENCHLFGLATEDNLTGLYVRQFFLRRLAEELYQSIRYGYPISLCIMDLDGFKDINDLYGHPAGDMVLQEVSHVIKRNIRLSDFAGRYGGDEFVIAYPYTDSSNVEIIASRLIRSMENHRILGSQKELSITFSMGIVTLEKEAISDIAYDRLNQISAYIDTLIEIADKALYESKVAGKNKFTIQKIRDINELL